MCQMCEEAKLYMAQLEAADRKAADGPKGATERKDGGAPGPSGSVATGSGRK